MMKLNKPALIVLLVAIAAITRLLPHPVNFGPMVAIALFAGASFKNRGLASLVVISAAVLSDLLVNTIIYSHYSLSYFINPEVLVIYGSYLLFMFMGSGIKNRSIPAIGGRSIIASLLFFVLSNLMVWASGSMYTADWAGLLSCYGMALPFLQNALAGDLIYSGLLFGSLELVVKRNPAWLKA